MEIEKIRNLTILIRYYILMMTTVANSGHPSSSLSAADLMACLFFRHLKSDFDTKNLANDQVIFSKGHVSPLVYALFTCAGLIEEEELLSYRKFESRLEGHPTPKFEYVQVSTGSLGQGLSIGLGMALGLQKSVDQLAASLTHRPTDPPTHRPTDPPKVYVLMGDSEIAEGSVWEAAQLASYYKVNNLVGIVDVNRLGQSRETMSGWDIGSYRKKFEAFGWEVWETDGHDLSSIDQAFQQIEQSKTTQPKVILAKTIKGKGVSLLEDKEGWHGKALSKEQFEEAVKELGDVDRKMRGAISKLSTPRLVPPAQGSNNTLTNQRTNILRAERSVVAKLPYKVGEEVATRKAYGEALAVLTSTDSRIIALDGETSNSTYSEIVREKSPDQYLEMFIAEQNMAGVALGLSKVGYIPFASTFAAFWTRAHDQIRMSAYSTGNVKYIGSHSGVSIGEDGPSQMGLEDLALFRSIWASTVLCPSDAVSCSKLTIKAAAENGLIYIRTSRPATKVIYKNDERFPIGGSKVLRQSSHDKLTIVACGVTVHEALDAHDMLAKDGIAVRIVDAYSIKPIDEIGLAQAAAQTGNNVITVEDHYSEGGLGDAVLNVFANTQVMVKKLAVSKMPMSGKPAQLLEFEQISGPAICNAVREVLGK